MNFETVIGLEVHVELKTKSKIFSAAPNQFGAEPNTNTTVYDLAYPGVLPVLNKNVVEYAMKAALALNMKLTNIRNLTGKTISIQTIRAATKFPNMINQSAMMDGLKSKYEKDGQPGYTKRIGITRLHMEEDAGKLLHTAMATPLLTLTVKGRRF